MRVRALLLPITIVMTERDKLAIQYTPLVYKVARSFFGKTPMTDEDIIGSAYEGLVQAMNKYKEGTSQSFKQYAAYQIRYAILNHINQEGYIVKFSAYNQNKAKEKGLATNAAICQSLSTTYDEDGNEDIDYKKMPVLVDDGADIIDEIDRGIVVSNIIRDIHKEFSERDCDIFMKVNGIDCDREKSTDVANEYNLSITSISLINKRITEYVHSQHYDL